MARPAAPEALRAAVVRDAIAYGCKDAAELWHVSVYTVRRWCHWQGITPETGRRRKLRRYTTAELHHAVQLHGGVRRAAVVLDCTPLTLRRELEHRSRIGA